MSYALYMIVRGKETCLGPLGSATDYSDVIDAVEKFDGVKRIPDLLHLVVEGETNDPQAAARDIFKMLVLEPELDGDVIASLQSLKQMLSKAEGNVIIGELCDAEKQRGNLRRGLNRQTEGCAATRGPGQVA